ncbi:hypothetical protein [Photobacterium atrarenae]|uniref:Uncharacterized protein n=1 Tax=Photobacterium atrarenae TaxID=865757 RepID=A0ABY5GCE9_9GAMM|nr:hypothetical protein [Photobacterium atrarenae]UTV26900.1 hypothetical protein NNL38_11135 [Photobacterium atrarenae]
MKTMVFHLKQAAASVQLPLKIVLTVPFDLDQSSGKSGHLVLIENSSLNGSKTELDYHELKYFLTIQSKH